MWITLSKVLPYLVMPLSVTLLCLLFGWLLNKAGWRRFGGSLIVIGILVILVFSSPPVANRLLGGLEGWYTPFAPQDAPQAQAIVLLGGAIGLPLSPRSDIRLQNGSDRVRYASQLFHAQKAPYIIITGGNVFEQIEDVQSEAFYISQLLQEWGVPKQAILFEGESRNTHENAVYTREILEARSFDRVLLVTSAFHMPRALPTFRAAGINAWPAPTDINVVNYQQPLLLNYLPSANALASSSNVLREYLGILIYGYLGWLSTDDIFTF